VISISIVGWYGHPRPNGSLRKRRSGMKTTRPGSASNSYYRRGCGVLPDFPQLALLNDSFSLNDEAAFAAKLRDVFQAPETKIVIAGLLV
jgi:hypothetical protein